MADDTLSLFRMPRASWGTILKCTWRQMRNDNLTALAAGAAYYALLSIFPALAALVSVYGLVTDPGTVQREIDSLSGVLPAEAMKLVGDWLHTISLGHSSKFGLGLLVGILAAAWSAWSATGMLMTAVNVCYREKENRSFLRFSLEALVLSVSLALFAVVGLACIALPPFLSSALAAGHAWAGLIALVRWPILAAISTIALTIIYRYAPSGQPRRWEWISWGAALATGLWMIASLVFSLYVARFASYDKSYGSIAAVVILLLWFHMSAYLVLAGAELNAELERQAAKTGEPQ